MPLWLIIVLACIALAGCASVPYDAGNLDGPSARCMRAQEPAEALGAGDDLVQKDAALRRSYGRARSKIRCLQKYARTVTSN